jgi:hypothetical protein
MNDDLDERSGVNRPGFTLHGGVLKGRADVNCAVHIHTETGMALAGLKHGLRMISQQAMRFYQRIGYHPYEGITEDFSERERILKALGSHRALVLQNHGLLTVGKNAREALSDQYDISRDHPAHMERLRWRIDRIRRGLRKGGGAVPDPRRRRGSADWPACLRMMDQPDPGWIRRWRGCGRNFCSRTELCELGAFREHRLRC